MSNTTKMTDFILSHPKQLIHTYIYTYKCVFFILVRCKRILHKMLQAPAVQDKEKNVFIVDTHIFDILFLYYSQLN